MAAIRPSSVSKPHSVDKGRNPVLKDITDTTAYLKAFCLVFKNDSPTQTIPPKKEHKV